MLPPARSNYPEQYSTEGHGSSACLAVISADLDSRIVGIKPEMTSSSTPHHRGNSPIGGPIGGFATRGKCGLQLFHYELFSRSQRWQSSRFRAVTAIGLGTSGLGKLTLNFLTSFHLLIPLQSPLINQEIQPKPDVISLDCHSKFCRDHTSRVNLPLTTGNTKTYQCTELAGIAT